MKKAELTVSEVLEFSRHDFLNELQLVLMYIELGKMPESKQAILKVSNKIKQLSMLSKLGLPATNVWLNTFRWMYPFFQTTYSMSIETGTRKVNDLELRTFLDTFFQDLVDRLDPLSEYEIGFEVLAGPSDWSITLTISGSMNVNQELPTTGNNFFAEAVLADNVYVLKISGN
ncbi:Spo0B domain-containing protein [Sporosarcina siberiensis]|uniref:Spo0B domain-containing protein n=1 Tax=Sporosarcina siberiensis TaxID=1365606 RepID=A0ABW4SCV1_9BACL